MRRLMVVLVAVGLTGLLALGAEVSPGAWVTAQEIELTPAAAITVTGFTVQNTAGDPALSGAHVERIQVRRDSPDGPILGEQSSGAQLGKLTTDGVPIAATENNTFTAGEHRLYVRVKLRDTAPLLHQLRLSTTVDPTGPTDVVAETTFEVGPLPDVFFEGVEDSEIYPGQRFLAGRITVDGRDLPFELTISRLFLYNEGAATRLGGAYVDRIEVRRASDGALLGQQTSGTELGKLTTDWTTINITSNNKVPAYTKTDVEIWITLKNNAPIGHNLKLRALMRCNGGDIEVGGEAPAFSVAEPHGFESVGNLALEGRPVYEGERFLAQRIKVVDDDLDPYDVTITSLVVRNIAEEDRLADTQIANIQVVRARDGALMGQVTDVSGLSGGGVRIPTTANNVVRDDTTEILEIWIRLKEHVPDGRKIQLESVVWHVEYGKSFGVLVPDPEYPDADYVESAIFTTWAQDREQGFEEADALQMDSRTVFQGQRFLAQKIKLEDDDEDPYDVIIESLFIRNASFDAITQPAPLADHNIVKIEVRRARDGALLGEVTNPQGMSQAGVRITTPENNRVPDDTSVELEIWVTLREEIPEGRKLKLATTVWHREGRSTFETDELVGPAEFTTDLADPPENVDFSWEPEEPRVGEKVEFTPDEAIDDPEGDIKKAEFHWDFGDGEGTTTTGPEAVEHTYTESETYEVTLTVTSEIGLSVARTHELEVLTTVPVVTIEWEPEEPAAGQEITFRAEIDDPAELEPYTYAWDFGDGNESTDESPTHTYEEGDTYTVTLVVTNVEGESGEAEREITVGEPVFEPPTVTAISYEPFHPEVNQTVQFSAEVSEPADDPVVGWEWRFGDGATSTAGAEVSHAYESPGTLTVEARARNELGGWSEWRSTQISVRPRGAGPVSAVLLANPVADVARIQVFAVEEATNLTMRVFDMTGRLLYVREVQAGEVTWDLQGDRGAAPSGIYFVLITGTVEGRMERSETLRLLVRRQ